MCWCCLIIVRIPIPNIDFGMIFCVYAVPDNGGDTVDLEVYHYDGAGGVALSMYNTDEVSNHTDSRRWNKGEDTLWTSMADFDVGVGMWCEV